MLPCHRKFWLAGAPLHLIHNMVDNATMFRINIHDMKTNLSKHLDELAPGERLLICRRNIAIAEVRRLATPTDGPRPLGLAAGSVQIPPSFFDPLPDDETRGFEG